MPDKKCFVVCPIGSDGSEIRDRADMFLEYIVRPALSANFNIDRSDLIVDSGIITEQIIVAIDQADLVVADLTGHNPNVFYELGLRHMREKPAIHMIAEGERIPFDVSVARAIPYSLTNPKKHKEAAESLAAAAAAAFAPGARVSNPVTSARGHVDLKQSGDSKDQLVAKLIETTERQQRELEELKMLVRMSTLASGVTSHIASPGVDDLWHAANIARDLGLTSHAVSPDTARAMLSNAAAKHISRKAALDIDRNIERKGALPIPPRKDRT